ncbi:MAG TPA: hypothetical protein VK573_00290 [Gemmatimonadales bacterium]|nr:hypothetical protein [Gemmatimonadales bacterium]
MTPPLAALLRWACDPAKLEAFAGDLEELHGERVSWRCVRDTVSICIRHSRLTAPLHRTTRRSLIAAAILLLLSGRVPQSAFHYTVRATDPAGEFTLEILNARVIAATLDGMPVQPEHVVQTGDTLVLKGGDRGRDFVIAIRSQGGITWAARQP